MKSHPANRSYNSCIQPPPIQDPKALTFMQRPFATSVVLCALVILGLISSTGCGSSSKAVSVKSIEPASGATDVSSSATVQITFTTSANPQTVNTTNIQIIDSNKNAIAGTVTYNASSNMATFAPTTPWTCAMTFTVTVAGVASLTGSAMTAPFSATFTTGPCGSPAQYRVSLFNVASENQIQGEILVDTTGAVTAKVQGAAATTTFAFQFCPAGKLYSSCIALGNITTDASGNASLTITFPQSGSWAGDFQLAAGGTTQYQTDVVPDQSSAVYVGTLQPASTVNGKGIYQYGAPGPQDPLTSGTVTVSGTTVQVQMTGTAPNSTYAAGECPLFFGSSCYELVNSQNQSGFTTDGNGNVIFSVLQDGVPGDIFDVGQLADHAGFVAGFNVP